MTAKTLELPASTSKLNLATYQDPALINLSVTPDKYYQYTAANHVQSEDYSSDNDNLDPSNPEAIPTRLLRQYNQTLNKFESPLPPDDSMISEIDTCIKALEEYGLTRQLELKRPKPRKVFPESTEVTEYSKKIRYEKLQAGIGRHILPLYQILAKNLASQPDAVAHQDEDAKKNRRLEREREGVLRKLEKAITAIIDTAGRYSDDPLLASYAEAALDYKGIVAKTMNELALDGDYRVPEPTSPMASVTITDVNKQPIDEQPPQEQQPDPRHYSQPTNDRLQPQPMQQHQGPVPRKQPDRVEENSGMDPFTREALRAMMLSKMRTDYQDGIPEAFKP